MKVCYVCSNGSETDKALMHYMPKSPEIKSKTGNKSHCDTTTSEVPKSFKSITVDDRYLQIQYNFRNLMLNQQRNELTNQVIFYHIMFII